MNESEFGERLRRARKSRQWGQRELAQKAELPVSQISNFERGYSLPRLETLFKLRLALECSWVNLLGRECGCGRDCEKCGKDKRR